MLLCLSTSTPHRASFILCSIPGLRGCPVRLHAEVLAARLSVRIGSMSVVWRVSRAVAMPVHSVPATLAFRPRKAPRPPVPPWGSACVWWLLTGHPALTFPSFPACSRSIIRAFLLFSLIVFSQPRSGHSHVYEGRRVLLMSRITSFSCKY